MGEVLLAQRVDEDGSISTWAIKRPLPTVAEDPELLGLFWKETELMQRLSHPAFPKVEEVAVSREGVPFLVMEYIPGISLADLLRSSPEVRGPIRPECWVLMASEVAAAVHELHRFQRGDRALIHGDVRAANVMLTPEGRVRLLDLGLALATDVLWARLLRGRTDLPPFLDLGERRREVDTYAIAKILIDCLGGPTRVFDDKSRLPGRLLEVLRKATDSSGLYAFNSARNLRYELQSHLLQDKLDQMRDELSRAVLAVMAEK
jgi:serine/threonine protein kinase